MHRLQAAGKKRRTARRCNNSSNFFDQRRWYSLTNVVVQGIPKVLVREYQRRCAGKAKGVGQRRTKVLVMFEAAEIAKFDKKERYEYEESLKAFRDLFSMVETAKLKGHAEGLEEGLKEGHAKGLEEGLAQGLREVERNKISTARKLKQLGLALADIVSVSGLSEEEIRQL